jgi:hypothetical protein
MLTPILDITCVVFLGFLALLTLVSTWVFLLGLMGVVLEILISLWRKSKLSFLAGKAKLLSPAGRVVLIQSVTSAIPAYYMQNVALPIRICTKLDKINRDFLWGSTDERKKMHMVSWDKVCRPKDLGGLGLYATKSRNIALLAKLNWRVMEEVVYRELESKRKLNGEKVH